MRLNKDMENTNEDADIALFDLKDFLIKNDAQLEEGQTFDSIIDERARPTVERRKLEAKTLILNSVKYMEDFDFKMNEVSMAKPTANVSGRNRNPPIPGNNASGASTMKVVHAATITGTMTCEQPSIAARIRDLPM